ncbi:hypothetical protein ACHAWF_000497 [Thalassiosira exigua]
MKSWLKWLRLTSEDRKLKMLNPDISPEASAEVYKVVDEMTSSSSSQVHYTLWKIAEMNDFCPPLVKMMSLPFMYGFANERWQHLIDVIKKESEKYISCVISALLRQISTQPREFSFPTGLCPMLRWLEFPPTNGEAATTTPPLTTQHGR